MRIQCFSAPSAIRAPERYSINVNLHYIIYYFTFYYHSIIIILQLALYIAALLLCWFRVLDDLQYHKLADETLEELGSSLNTSVTQGCLPQTMMSL